MAITTARLKELLDIANARKKAAIISIPPPTPIGVMLDADDIIARDKAIASMQLESVSGAPITTENDFIADNLVHTTTPNGNIDISSIPPQLDITQGIGRDGNIITYNQKQLSFMQIAVSGEPCVLLGAAGCGKTTCMQGTTQKVIQSGRIGLMSVTHKYLPKYAVPGIVIIAFTRRATANIRRAMPADLKANCITHHKLLEYEPVYYSVIDPISGKETKTMRFQPTRHQYNPLPSDIRLVIVEESSMYSTDLDKELRDALSPDVQFIYLGDIQQLPPVFGSAILGYKMLEYKTIELTEVYRQALESPIIRLAHRVLSGKPIPASEYPAWKFENQLTIHPWKKQLLPWTGINKTAEFMIAAHEAGQYDPEEDIILTPQNVNFGTDDLNRLLGQFLAAKRHSMVYEIIGGFDKSYLSVGDKVLYDKEDAIVIDIAMNPMYFGRRPQPASYTLDYFGHEQGDGSMVAKHNDEMDDAAMDAFLDAVETNEETEKVRKASHIVTLRMQDTGIEVKLTTAGEINVLLLSYALTVHKSQGSEWRKVFFILQHSQNKMIQRELLYTGVTRAKEELYIICEPDTFTKGILSQKIKGNTLAEKAIWFQGKLEINGGY